MNLRLVERLVNVVLYEGYILYPYRPSAVKNQQRFNFGALCPESYSVAQRGTEAWSMQTECLVRGGPHTAIDLRARFLHLLAREVGELTTPLVELREGVEPDFHIVEKLEVGDQLFQTWQEAVERDVSAPNLDLNDLVRESLRLAFAFPSKREVERLRDASGKVVGVIVRKQSPVEGAIEVAAENAGDNLFKVSVRILNRTTMEDAKSRSRDDALMQSLVSTHTILGVHDGEFVSLLDTPAAFRDAAAGCHNIGTWPVLVGEAGERDCMLSSPIILYDYPEIAPESPGDLFDGTEIDEILTLRIMTLTDEEKRAMRGVDERARQILERTETLPAEQLMKMHGAMRSLRSVEEDER
jgi:hydrogenase maturation protease